MKYGYEGADLSELINNYKIEGDKIVITYLDKSTFDVAFTESTEKTLLEEMLKQAYDRNASEEMCLAQKRKRRATMLIVYETIVGALVGVLSFINKDELQTLDILFLEADAMFITLNGIDYKIQKSEIEELEKYDLYLNMRSKIVGVPNEILLNGIKSDERGISINNLDNFSLSDGKRINQNINRFHKYSQENDQVTSPTLTYKNRKNQ